MKEKLSIQDLDLKNKKALIRVDFNVPLENKTITDDSRIRASLPTIQYAIDHGAAVILMSHLGRPKGVRDQKYSLKPCAKRLSELLNHPVKMAKDCCGESVEKLVKDLHPGDILLLENLRFHLGEESPKKEPTFAVSLSSLGDVYINDAFGSAHRSHASITELPKFFPGKAVAGFLMKQELAYLGSTLMNPSRPFYAILGGSKISTKFKVIEMLMQRADVLMIGGAMAFNFFKAQEISIGDSLVENDFIPVARQLLDVSSQSRCKILLPLDIVAAKEISGESPRKVIKIKDGIPKGYKGLDIGPETIRFYQHELSKATTIFWNGPMGIFETPPFDQGTTAIAQIIANLPVATTIVGGGDTVAAVDQAGLSGKMSHLSTGGGAALEFIEFGTLPGIDALSDK
ncbi:MAG: phosphoglycerate kinase [Parachlamydiaceae bacterium]|nr:phosphoglycerate kinase [Parachlamydiaceae bacterium]